MMHHLVAHAATAAAKAACGGPGQGPCHHITYLEAVVSGLIQGVTELFPISSLGHNVLLPALVGGHWADALDVSAKDSPYLAFVVGLHVATAVAMIAFFWRDWLRIIGGLFSSLRSRSVSTPDERLAWMIILATIPVGLAGLVLQKEVKTIFAKPELAATFLAINGVILITSERMRRNRVGTGDSGRATGMTRVPETARSAFERPAGGPEPAGPSGGPPWGYSQQPRQQQWQGPGNSEDDWGYGQRRDGQYGQEQYGQEQRGREQYGQEQYGQEQYGQEQYGQEQYGQEQRGQGQYDPWGGRGGSQAPDPWGEQRARRQGQEAWGGQQSWGEPESWGGQRAAEPRGPRAPQPARRSGGEQTARPAERATETDHAIAADRRLSTMGSKRAVLIGAAQILALMPGISRDGIVTVAGMWRGIRREDAVRFSFLLSAPVILAAGALKMHDLTGPMGKGSHGPMLVGAIIAGIAAYLSIRFLTKYFSEDKSLNPFGIYCIVAGIGSLAYLLLVK